MPPQWVSQCERDFIKEKKAGLEERKALPLTVLPICL